jgi:hypothetical protein
METTLFSMINVETPVIVAEDSVESAAELVTLGDAFLRQVGGGMVMEVQY